MDAATVERRLRAMRRRERAQGILALASPRSALLSARVLACSRREDLEERGKERLASLLYHTATRVPYYRHALGFAETSKLPDRADSSLSLADFPVVTKQIRRATPLDDFISRDPDKGPHYYIDEGPFFLSRTSGSTGVPTTHLKSVGDYFWEYVAEARIHAEWGIPHFGDVYSTGLFRQSRAGSTGLHSSARALVDHVITPGAYVRWNLFDVSQSGPAYIDDVAVDARMVYDAMLSASGDPVMIQGAPSRMLGLARHCLEHGTTKRPKAVLTSYEPLLESDRRLLAEAFRCPIVSVYSLSDLGTLAWECSHRRFHFDPDLAAIEILDENDKPVEPGRSGRIVVTSLGATVMPLIRYDSGDLVTLAATACPCGNQSPSATEIEGRQVVRFTAESGRTFESHLFLRVLDQCAFREFQLVQDLPGRLTVIVLPGTVIPRARVDEAEQTLFAQFKERFAVEVEASGAFVLTPSGKRNPAISRLQPTR